MKQIKSHSNKDLRISNLNLLVSKLIEFGNGEWKTNPIFASLNYFLRREGKTSKWLLWIKIYFGTLLSFALTTRISFANF